MSADVPCSDKLDNKPDNKLIPRDADLQTVMRLWHRLPPRIRSGILAMIQAFRPADDQQPPTDTLNGLNNSEE